MMYTCIVCQHRSTSKLGKCPSCGEYATFEKDEKSIRSNTKKGKKWDVLCEQKAWVSRVLPLSNKELQRVFCEGVRTSWVYLLAWEPGIGKSTLSLQLFQELLWQTDDVSLAYFSAEEHPDEVRKRRKRLVGKECDMFPVFHTQNVEDMLATVDSSDYDVIVVDSIQTIHSLVSDSPAWAPTQVRQCSDKLVSLAKKNNVAVVVIGHVTKWGEIAGPKYLEHIVDVVMYIEWEQESDMRFLRSRKNRFWPANDVGIFDMTLFGLQPVIDMKERIVSQVAIHVPGTVFSIGIDNGRPIIIRIEALLNKTSWKYPVRRVIGVDSKRVDMIIAILEKYLDMKLWFLDVYINVPGGLRLFDAGIDVAIAVAIMSQYYNQTISMQDVFVGEIWLTGQINKSSNHQKRLKDFAGEFVVHDASWYKHIVEYAKYIKSS